MKNNTRNESKLSSDKLKRRLFYSRLNRIITERTKKFLFEDFNKETEILITEKLENILLFFKEVQVLKDFYFEEIKTDENQFKIKILLSVK